MGFGQMGYSQALCENAVPMNDGFSAYYDPTMQSYPNMAEKAPLYCKLNHGFEYTYQNQNGQILIFSYTVEDENNRMQFFVNQNNHIPLTILSYGSCEYINDKLLFSDCLYYENSTGNYKNWQIIVGNNCEHSLKKGQTIYFVVRYWNKLLPPVFEVKFRLFPDTICQSAALATDDCVDAPTHCSKKYEGATYCCYSLDQPQILTSEYCNNIPSYHKENSWMKIIPSKKNVKLKIHNRSNLDSFYLGIFKGECNNFQKIPDLCDDGEIFGIEFKELNTVIPGDEYYIMTSRTFVSRPEYTLDFDGIVHSDNDDCGNAETLICGDNRYNGLHCASDADAPIECTTGQKLGAGLWYSIAGSGELMTVSTANAGTNFDAIVHIYEGNCANILTCKSGASRQGTASVTFPTVCGEKYYVYVSSKTNIKKGIFELAATCGNFSCPSLTINGPTSICKNETGNYIQSGGCVNGTWQVAPDNAGTISTSGMFTAAETYSGEVIISYTIGGCSGDLKVVVSSLGISGVVIEPICGAENGSVRVSPVLASYKYEWSNGTSGPLLNNVADGNYTITVTDLNNGCTDTETFTLKSQNNPPFAGIDAVVTVCDTMTIPIDLNKVFVDGVAAGGLWRSVGATVLPGRFYGVDGTFDVYLHPSGQFNFEYIVNNVCGSDTSIVTVFIEKVKNASLTSNYKICNYVSSNGTPILDLMSLIVSGDTGGYWTKSSNTPKVGGTLPILDFTGAVPGMYVYTYHLDGCSPLRYDVVVNVESCDCPTILRAKYLTFCETEPTFNLKPLLETTLAGKWEITQGVSGSTAGISGNQWLTNGTPSGQYELTYTLDTPLAGCPDSAKAILVLERAPRAGQNIQIEICDTLSNPLILRDYLPGSDDQGRWSLVEGMPISGSFNVVNGTFKVKGNTAGIYKFRYRVLGVLLCEAAESEITIMVRKCDCTMTVEAVTQAPSCSGKLDGSIDLQITGATGNTQILWSDSQWNGSNKVTGIGQGQYVVTVTDQSNCEVIKMIDLKAPDPVIITCSPQDETKYGARDGSCSINLTGGISPYNIVWSGPTSNSATVQNSTYTINMLAPGPYNVTLEDANGCLSDCAFTIKEYDCKLTATFEKKDITCFGNRDGIIDIKVAQGSGMYDFQWSISGYNGKDVISDLAPGNYKITVTDKLTLCTQTVSVDIDELTPLSVVCQPKDVIAPAQSGQISLNISGGRKPYQISWLGSMTGALNTMGTETNVILKDLNAGTYMVTIKDSVGCITTCNSEIKVQPCTLDIQVTKYDASCETSCDGIIILKSTTLPASELDIKWSVPGWEDKPTVNNVCPGQYSVTVSTANGCEWSSENMQINVVDTFEVKILASKNKVKRGEAITLKIESNIQTSQIISFFWDGETVFSCTGCEETTVVIEKETEINVEVVDDKGCVRNGKIRIFLSGNQVYLPNIISGEGANKDFFVQGQGIERVVYMKVYDRWGNILFNKENFSDLIPENGWRGEGVQSGVYIYDIMVLYQDQTLENMVGDITLIK